MSLRESPPFEDFSSWQQSAMIILLNEYVNYETLPTYRESKRSPRCEEDISNPAPSYGTAITTDGADQIAQWLALETRRFFRRQ